MALTVLNTGDHSGCKPTIGVEKIQQKNLAENGKVWAARKSGGGPTWILSWIWIWWDRWRPARARRKAWGGPARWWPARPGRQEANCGSSDKSWALADQNIHCHSCLVLRDFLVKEINKSFNFLSVCLGDRFDHSHSRILCCWGSPWHRILSILRKTFVNL